MIARALRLCLVTNLQDKPFSAYQPVILKAIQGGVTSIQLREKTKNLFEFKQLALQVQATLRPFNIPLIINDHVEIAKEIDADGVHIGQSDLSPYEARKILGPAKIIGWSVETLEELEIANQLTCIDYVAASAVFPSRTKPDCKTIWGISGLQQVAQLSKHPVMAIGGINLNNIEMIIDSGAYGAAVIGAIHNHDPRKSAADLIAAIDYFAEKKEYAMLKKIKNVVAKIKEERPLILNITNDVTMDFIANGLLSLGASPVMSKAQQEIDDLLQLANVVVINLGTLDEKFIALCEYVCGIANQLKKPIILDPVGAGASHYRTNTSLHLINNYDIAIIRGNASEIMSLSGEAIKTKGVDSVAQSNVAIDGAKILSNRYDVAVVVSGEIDVIVDMNRINQLAYGSPLMPQITGTGCLLSAVVGAFHAIEKNRFDASVLATAFYGMCGEKAAQQAQGPASFKVKFLDELHLIPEDLAYEKG